MTKGVDVLVSAHSVAALAVRRLMADESWFESAAVRNEGTPSFFAREPLAPPPVPRKSTYELRPLTTGEVLDRTFYLYRNNFWLFAGISAVAATVSTVTAIMQQVYLHFRAPEMASPKPSPAAVMAHLGPVMGVGLVAGLLYLVVYSVTQAATVKAVTAIYLGQSTSMKAAFDAVKGRWVRYFGIALWQAWSAIWLYLLLVAPGVVGVFLLARHGGGANTGMVGAMVGLGLLMVFGGLGAAVYGIIAYIRNSLAVPAEVMEGLTIRAAMRRSKVLAAGTKGRIFLLFLMLAVLGVVVGGVEMPLAFLMAKSKGMQMVGIQAMLLFVNFVVRALVGPVGAIGLCLFYIDQRVRKEGFDIEVLMERAGTVNDAATAVAAPVAYPLDELP
jgi:hypothetical protein